jgi:hypothetical protein
MIIDFKTIDRGDYSGHRSICKMIIANLEQWTNFWQIHVKEMGPPSDYHYYYEDEYEAYHNGSMSLLR